ncbi:hypothetical protein [Bartonella sp. DGB1]|uniref:hypothetical protein n=1 Tax=Bartonella sp. DGB1 TaxID=3239807 RepID=UPI003526B375
MKLKSENKNFLITLIFMGLFIFFVYGLLLLGLRNVAELIINHYQWSYMQDKGDLGIIMVILLVLSFWFSLYLIPATLIKFITIKLGRIRLGQKINIMLFFAVFHIFAFIVAIYPQLRQSSPILRKRYYLATRRYLSRQKVKQARDKERAILRKRYKSI